MAAFKHWVDELLPGVPPKSALGKALSYTTHQWAKISRFLDHREMPAENNYAENQVRPFAVGRRSWLFCHSAVGATASANLFTLVMSCGAHRTRRLTRLRPTFPDTKSLRCLARISRRGCQRAFWRASKSPPLSESLKGLSAGLAAFGLRSVSIWGYETTRKI